MVSIRIRCDMMDNGVINMLKKIAAISLVLFIAVSCSAKDDNPFAPQNLIDDLEFELSQDEVKEKYAPYEPIVIQDSDVEVWRYDFLINEEYEVNDEENDSDIDYMGLYDEELSAQLFVQWNDQGFIDAYSVYYLEDENRIYHYLLTADGEESEQLVFQIMSE